MSKANWIVMPAFELTPENLNRESSFKLNATGLNKNEAEIEAQRRNEVENECGHLNVLWFPSPSMEDLL